MRSVLDDYDLIPTNVTLGADYENAMEGWARSATKYYARSGWPQGVPLYFRGPNGHVAIGLANGLIRSTQPGGTGMLTTTLGELERLTGDPYLGYALDFNGHLIDLTGTSGGGGDDMNLTDTVTTGSGTASVNDYFYYTYRDVKAANTKLDALTAAVSALALGAGLDPVALGKSIAASVDAALADDFASLSTKIGQSLDALSQTELDAIAKTVLDAQAKRLVS